MFEVSQQKVESEKVCVLARAPNGCTTAHICALCQAQTAQARTCLVPHANGFAQLAAHRCWPRNG